MTDEEHKAAGNEVRALGGLYILGTERHESRRIDNQLRGRAGRQGDPGESKFFVSMEDELMRLFGDRANRFEENRDEQTTCWNSFVTLEPTDVAHSIRS